MTVIAWDGRSIAADKMMCVGDTPMATTKLRKVVFEGYEYVVGVTGGLDYGLALIDWWVKGADQEKWPAFQATDNWTRLIVVPPGSKPYWFERMPYPIECNDEFAAWGSGRELALGALAMGASAKEAVEVANRLGLYSGLGVDVFEVGR